MLSWFGNDTKEETQINNGEIYIGRDINVKLSCQDISGIQFDGFEELFDKYPDEDWNMDKICCTQYLSEKFIDRYHHKVNWGLISLYQPLDKDFFNRVRNDLMALRYTQFSDEFLER